MSAGADPRFIAAVDFIGHTGTKFFQLRFCEEEQPLVWVALGAWEREGGDIYECAAAMNPTEAALRLCEVLADGGQCTHCGRPTGFEPQSLEELPMDDLFCWYQFDPELAKFRRGCEGET